MTAHIRWMIRRDLDQVLAIERSSFQFAWTEEDFIECLRQRNCIGLVAEVGGSVVGFVIYELLSTKLHLLNLAVHPSDRRIQVGRQLIARLAGKLSSHKRSRMVLECRESNLGAHLFFRACGFVAVDVLRGYYEDSGEDAYRFSVSVGSAIHEYSIRG